MQINIDGDLVAYRCAASVAIKLYPNEIEGLSEEEIQLLKYPDDTEEIAILRTDKLMRDLIFNTDSTSYICFLSGRNNFRKKVMPSYKANRTSPPPRWLQQCREYLSKEFNALVSDGCEADDYLGMNQTDESICVSLDKDLRMIPGWHFNWTKNEKDYIVPLDGLRHFYKQMLIGDKTDNIIGVWQIGQAKADKLIDPLETEEEMIQVVFDKYNEDAPRFWMNAQCLWIWRKMNETWHHRVDYSILPDPLKLEWDTRYDFMNSLMEGTTTEPSTTQAMTSGIPNNGDVMDESQLIEKMT